MPSNNQPVAYGVSEDCAYNDHDQCRTRGCRCDCHQPKRAAEDAAPVNRIAAAAAAAAGAGSMMNPKLLEKVCPQCKVRYEGDRNFCVADGTKLSSLLCAECGNVADPVDNFCGYCGFPMKGGERQQPSEQQLEDTAMGPKVELPDSVKHKFAEQPQQNPIITMGMFK